MGYFDLTPREKDVLKSLSSGKSRLGIALELGICKNTVNSRLDAIFFKTEVSKGDSPALAAVLWWADRYGLPNQVFEEVNLSTIQMQVLSHLVKGRGRSHIRENLYMSQRTAEHHLRHIYNLLGVSQDRTKYPLIYASVWFLSAYSLANAKFD